MRLCIAIAAIALSGCKVVDDAEPGAPVECAFGDEAYQVQCDATVNVEGGANYLTIRHPDGGFRRFRYRDDVTELQTADGADEAVVVVSEDKISIAVDSDRYVVPLAVLNGQGNVR